MKTSGVLSILILMFVASNVVARGHGGFHGHGGGFGFGIGYPGFYGPSMGFYSGYGYGMPRYQYYDPPVIVPSTPPVYIEKSTAQQPPANFWYYCQNPAGYYPSVKACPGGWQQVAPIQASHK